MCWAYDLVDPWGNQYELNCYEYDQVRADLIEAEAIAPMRYWPRDRQPVAWHRDPGSASGAPRVRGPRTQAKSASLRPSACPGGHWTSSIR
jgi:hypothetical protein